MSDGMTEWALEQSQLGEVDFVLPSGSTTEFATARQVGGNHYKDMEIQPIEYILANRLGYCAGNVVKYISRYKAKNGIEDLRKAKHYIELLIESEMNK